MKTTLTLNSDAANLRPAFQNAHPFPHIVIDHLLDDAELDEVLHAFPEPGSAGWTRFRNPHEEKLGTSPGVSFPEPIQIMLWKLNGPVMLGFLERLTGIDGLVPDPWFGGGGLHHIPRGGHLGVHTDFNWHPKLQLYRRLNLLIYLNRDWDESWGGALELWEEDGAEPARTIAPLCNRAVIFETSSRSFHGHPHPLECPSDRARRSLSLYYYTREPGPDGTRDPHDTLFVE